MHVSNCEIHVSSSQADARDDSQRSSRRCTRALGAVLAVAAIATCVVMLPGRTGSASFASSSLRHSAVKAVGIRSAAQDPMVQFQPPVPLASQLAPKAVSPQFQNHPGRPVAAPGASAPLMQADGFSFGPSSFGRREAILAGVAGAMALGVPKGADAEDKAAAQQELQDLEDVQSIVFKEAVPSVVYVGTEYSSVAADLKLPTEAGVPKGVGTGFVWDKNGHIVTNFHVINKVDDAFVELTKFDGTKTKYKVKLTGVDPDKDVAVLKIDAPADDLRVLPVGDSEKTRVGQFSYAIGNPFGQDHSLSTGVISGKNRQITAPTGRRIQGIIQTDAAINPGNSGGPLLDSSGRVIGINTASLGAGVSAGVGFAVPIALARPSIEQIIEFGQVQRAILGLSYLERAPTKAESERSGLPVVEKGVVVLDVPKGSPGDLGGIIAIQKDKTNPRAKATIGDVIIGIDKNLVNSPTDLNTVLAKYKPGAEVDVIVLRGNAQEKKMLRVKLGGFQAAAFSKLETERGPGFNGLDGGKLDLNKPLFDTNKPKTLENERAPGFPDLPGFEPGSSARSKSPGLDLNKPLFDTNKPLESEVKPGFPDLPGFGPGSKPSADLKKPPSTPPVDPKKPPGPPPVDINKPLFDADEVMKNLKLPQVAK